MGEANDNLLISDIIRYLQPGNVNVRACGSYWTRYSNKRRRIDPMTTLFVFMISSLVVSPVNSLVNK